MRLDRYQSKVLSRALYILLSFDEWRLVDQEKLKVKGSRRTSMRKFS